MKEPGKLSELLSLDTTEGGRQMEPNSYVKSFISKMNLSLNLIPIGLYENLKQKHMNSQKLFPMGRVFHIHDAKTQSIRRGSSYYDFVLREVNSMEYFEEIIFSKQFIKHHFPYFYEEGLCSNRVLFQDFLPVTSDKVGSGSGISGIM